MQTDDNPQRISLVLPAEMRTRIEAERQRISESIGARVSF